MPDLLLRGLDDSIKRRLSARARASGRSLSEEAKAILQLGLAAPEEKMGFGTRLRQLLGTDFADLDLPERSHDGRPVPDFS
jgi:antitoxin FitA